MLGLYYGVLAVIAFAVFFLACIFEKKQKKFMTFICYAFLYLEVLLFV